VTAKVTAHMPPRTLPSVTAPVDTLQALRQIRGAQAVRVASALALVALALVAVAVAVAIVVASRAPPSEKVKGIMVTMTG